MATEFRPALLVVDFQEDFCPPHGSLAVAGGRDIAPVVNSLLSLPFALKLATKDWHPESHVSFAANHVGAQPFVSTTIIRHPSSATPLRERKEPPSPPLNAKSRAHSPGQPPQSSPTPPPCSDSLSSPTESMPMRSCYETRLWPIHCVQHTAGARLVPELNVAALDGVIEKGTDDRVEMYSAFYDPLGVCDTGLAALLRRERISHVYVVGLAADYCVRSTAEDAAREGFATVVVDEGTRPVDPAAWAAVKHSLEGVAVVSVGGWEVARVRRMGGG